MSGNKRLKVEFGPITKDNIEQLRKINAVSFPVQYNQSFYDNIWKDKNINSNSDLNKYAYWNEYVVGAICTRIESAAAAADDVDGKRLYIMTLAVLAAYRQRGIGSQLLESVLSVVQDSMPEIKEIALHVQISNDDAIRFYTEKFGFVKGDVVENYYKRIDPPHCYLLYKKIQR